MNIYFKRFFYLGTRISQALGSDFFPSRKNKKFKRVVFYPEFETAEEIADQLNRIRWYIPNIDRVEIFLPVIKSLNNLDLNTLSAPKSQRSFNGIGAKINLCNINDIKTNLTSSDLVCLWNTKKSWLKNLSPYIHKLRIVDPSFYLFTETHTYPALLWYDLFSQDQRKSLMDNSKRVMKKLFSELANNNRAYVLGTGPSIKEAQSYSFSNGVRIICNSMVKNDELLEHIQPQVLTFSDSVFHFGVSKYAEEFAKDVLKVVKRFGTYCITNPVGYALMLAHYPELKDYLIGVPVYRIGKPIPLNDKTFKTRDYANILTRYMLPLAAGLSKEVVLLGFDGRNPDENYFWKHNPSTQYTDSMESAKITHEAFFRDISYDNYYSKHCRIIEKMVSEYENRGIKVITWGNSFIPPLQERLVNFENSSC